MPFLTDNRSLHLLGCPIRRSEDQSLLAAPSRVSSLGTSFIGTPPLGIPQTPYVSLDYSFSPHTHFVLPPRPPKKENQEPSATSTGSQNRRDAGQELQDLGGSRKNPRQTDFPPANRRGRSEARGGQTSNSQGVTFCLRFSFTQREIENTRVCRCFIHPCNSAHFFVYSFVKVQGAGSDRSLPQKRNSLGLQGGIAPSLQRRFFSSSARSDDTF